MSNSTISGLTTNGISDNDLLVVANTGVANYKVSRANLIKMGMVNVKDRDYGAKGDTKTVTDGVMNSGSGVLTSNTASFASTDVGKSVSVAGAGASGISLTTTIASFQSTTQVTLAATASTSVTGATTIFGTDDTSAINSALTAAQSSISKRLYLPAGTYLISGVAGNLLNVTGNNLEVCGDGVGRTIILYAPGQTLTAVTTLFNLTGNYQSIHDLSIIGGNGLNAALTFGNVGAGGLNYNVNDTITLAGGTFTTGAVVKVTSTSSTPGPITGATLNTGGSYTFEGVVGNSGGIYTQGSTSGTGTEAQFNMSGPSLVGVAIAQGAYNAKVYNLDISGMWGLNNAGGAGVTANQPPQQNEFSTTLGTTFVAGGVQTVTPGSMAGIYPGRTLRITGTNAETIQVTSVTPTTLTATFASAHNSTDAINGWSLGNQYCAIENVVVHDCYSASGMTISSGRNVIRNCRINSVGSNGNQHGFYIQQGGGNKFQSCYVEGTSVKRQLFFPFSDK